MKTKKNLKRAAAVLLSTVLLLTSLPMAFSAAADFYNPAPYFSEEAQREGASAWINQEGDLQVRFPSASGSPTHAAWSLNHNETANVKAIKSYVVELSDLGGKLEAHNVNPSVLLSKTIDASGKASKFSAVFTAEEIETLGENFDFENRRYNISITAVDNEGWRSLALNALVFDVPEFYFDSSKFHSFSEDQYAMRELMRFENAGDYTGYQQSGDSVDRISRIRHDGAEDQSTGINSMGYRIRIVSRPGEGGQSIDTPESRQTWDFRGAEEVWYWLDLSEVELEGVSFRLRANDKKIDWDTQKGQMHKNTQRYSSVVYSTLGTKFNTYAAGEEPYILLQNENGNWDKVTLNNGTVDIGHFKGYVRIPTKYMCSETATQVTASNAWFGQKLSFKNAAERDRRISEEVYMIPYDGWHWNGSLLKPDHAVTTVDVDPAGTAISDALLIQEGYIIGTSGSLIVNKNYEYELGAMLAPGVTDADISLANNPRRSSIVNDGAGNWSVQRAEDPYTPLEDIYSAGIAYQDVSEESLEKSIFLDNIMFYRTDGKEWPEAVIDTKRPELTKGTAVATYFDQGTDTQDKILDAIDEYIGSPSWSDYRGVKYVDDMIAAFTEAYRNAKGEDYISRYLTPEKIAERAAAMKRTETWNNYLAAKTLCKNEGLMDGNNSRSGDLVPMLVQALEALPDPSQVTTVSDALYDEIIKIYQTYIRLNYGQLRMLGNYVSTDGEGNTAAYFEEEKILKYAELVINSLEEDTETGYRMANYPFIPFNTFEQNTEVGDKAWRLEDDPKFASSSDYRSLKNFSVLTTNDKKIVDGNGQTISQEYLEAHDYAHSGDTRITKDGYAGTKGLTTTFNSAALQGNHENGSVFYAMYFNKDSKNDAADTAAFRANNMAAANLGQLAKNNDKALEETVKKPDGSIYLPFSLVMYVDFSELNDENNAGDFTFGLKIHTLNSNGEEICYRPAMGVGNQNKFWRSYFLLDQDPNSANFGEWKRVFSQSRGALQGNYLFPSKTTNANAGEEPASLAGYKGYMAIPINHFKRSSGGVDNDFLVTHATELNNIYSITFAITNANGAAMSGKSITIDNVGFTYDPEFYKDHLSTDTSGRNDKSYDEAFGAKSTKASEFEAAVAAIDPYDEASLAGKIEEAKKLYGAPYNDNDGGLSQWQKDNIKTVQQAKALLDKYIAGDIPKAAMTVGELKAAIAALPNIPENAVAENPLPNPGFVREDGMLPTDAGAVNYAAFGFDSKEQAEAIAKYYTDTYKYLSSSDKASLTDEERTTLLNAYNAAMRCTGSLEIVKDKATEFSDHLKTVYTPYTDGTNTLTLINIAKRNEVVKLAATDYEPLPYYAKLGLGDGSLIPAFANMTDGISRFIANVITDEAGNITDGGVKTLLEKYTKLYSDVKAKLDAKEIIPDALAKELNDAIAEYNDLIPAYKNIFELYYGSEQEGAGGAFQGIKDIVELFMRTDVSFDGGAAEATLALNPDNESTASQTLNVNYIEELPVDNDGNTTTYFTIKYNGTLTGGVDARNYILSLNGKDVPAVDIAADPIVVTEDMLGAPIKNNSYTEEKPYELVFKARLNDTRLFAQQLSDTVEICHYRPADTQKGETEPVLLGTYKLNVTYTPGEAFTVTIPAEIPVDWGDTSKIDVSYSVDCVLGSGKKIDVDVTGNGVLTAEENSAYTMDYAKEGFNIKTAFQGVHSNSKPADIPAIQISEEMWNNSPVGKYKDTLTYTVEYTKS